MSVLLKKSIRFLSNKIISALLFLLSASRTEKLEIGNRKLMHEFHETRLKISFSIKFNSANFNYLSYSYFL